MDSYFSSRYWILITLFLAPEISYASPLAFDSYKVSEVYRGAHKLKAGAQGDKNLEEVRKNALKVPVNFAGHYVIYTTGCGGSTLCGEILDVKTGEVVESFPNAYYIDGEDGTAPFSAASEPDSRLLIITGVAADTETGMKGEELDQGSRQRYYEFLNNKLLLINIVKK
ncbi:hypothetical protein F0169_00980 [Pseudomonas sp. MAFF 212408]|uniref:Uncharacterized protein n=1 Tax=Pseudomonas kitaguniensis TaxID=2607908 RepID=A0A5N7KGF0_9PSED|nr:hypothetical protein [Pseudomonas kitaguniensis]MPR00765.1 hypothetical protein [Pseudomonas kitaguniensis]